jgi:hypothetical protein
VLSSIPPPDGAGIFLDLFNVRYLKDESRTLEEELEGEFPRCGYPSLEFKRAKKYGYEKEARFVMHDYSAVLVHPELHRKLAVDGPQRLYAAIDPSVFIENVYLLNDFSKAQANTLLAELDYQPALTYCTAAQLVKNEMGTEHNCNH